MAKTFEYLGPNSNAFWLRLNPPSRESVSFRLRLLDPARLDVTLTTHSVPTVEFLEWLEALDHDHDVEDQISRGVDPDLFPEPDVRWLLPGIGLGLTRIQIPSGPNHDRLIWSVSNKTFDGDPYTADSGGVAVGIVTGIGGGRRLTRGAHRYVERAWG